MDAVRNVLYSIRRLHGKMYDRYAEKKRVTEVYRKIQSMDPDAVLYVLTPTHGNLGDHAIAKASKKLFKTYRISYVEITDYELRLLRRYSGFGAMNGRTILVNGG